MTSTLYNSWGEFRHSLTQLFALSTQSLCIFDADLAQMGFDQTATIQELQRLLRDNPSANIRIALKRTDHLHRDHPRLINLLNHHGHAVHVQQTHESLAPLRDTLVIADGIHAVIRFDQDHPRSKLLLASKPEVAPYLQRFEDIWLEGGEPFSPTQLGL